MRASGTKKWLVFVVGLVAVMVFACAMGLICKSNTTIPVANAEGDLFPQEIDTDINGYTDWGAGGVTMKDARVYKETTLWDIKTRIAVYAKIQRSNGAVEDNALLKANEFNIKLTVDGIIYSDVDDDSDHTNPIKGNLKGMPFASFGESGSTLHENNEFEVTVTPLVGGSVGMTSSLMLGNGAKTVRVKLSYHPSYSVSKGLIVTMGDNPMQNPIYTSTVFRNFTKYEFFYKASITGVLKANESAPVWEEVPRELLTATMTNEQFIFGTSEANSVNVTYTNPDSTTVVGAIDGNNIYVDVPKVVSVKLEVNNGDGGTVTGGTNGTYYRRASRLPDVFAVRDGNGNIIRYEDDGGYTYQLGIPKAYQSITSNPDSYYYAFVAGMHPKLLGFALRAVVRDSNGVTENIRCDDGRIKVGQVVGGQFTEDLPAPLYNNNDTFYNIQVKYSAIEGSADTTPSNTLSLRFYSRANSYIYSNITDTSLQKNELDISKTVNADLLNSLYGTDEYNNNILVVNRVERDGRCSIMGNGAYTVSGGLYPVTYYKDSTQTANNWSTSVGEEQYGNQFASQEELNASENLTGDTSYVRALTITSNAGSGTCYTYIPVMINYSQIARIEMVDRTPTTREYNVNTEFDPSGCSLTFAQALSQEDFENDDFTYADGSLALNKTYSTTANNTFSKAGFRAWGINVAARVQRAFGQYAVLYYTADELKNMKAGKTLAGGGV